MDTQDSGQRSESESEHLTKRLNLFGNLPKFDLKTETAIDLDACFGSLAHPIRRAMIEQLSQGDATVTELAKPHRVSLPAISKHLHILDEAGIVKIQADGSMRRVHLRAKPLHGAFDWIGHYRIFWEERLDRLAQHLGSKNKGA